MTATLRTQLARSRQAQSGAKRVEVVLDADEQNALHWFRVARGLTSTSEAIKALIEPHILKPGEHPF